MYTSQLQLSVVNLSFFLQDSLLLLLVCVSSLVWWWGWWVLQHDDVTAVNPASCLRSSSAEGLPCTLSVPSAALPTNCWLRHICSSLSKLLMFSSLFSSARVSCSTSLSRASNLLSSAMTVSRPNLQQYIVTTALLECTSIVDNRWLNDRCQNYVLKPEFLDGRKYPGFIKKN